MVNTVHEDDLAVWEISISDFELEDHNVLLEGLERLARDSEKLVHVLLEPTF